MTERVHDMTGDHDDPPRCTCSLNNKMAMSYLHDPPLKRKEHKFRCNECGLEQEENRWMTDCCDHSVCFACHPRINVVPRAAAIRLKYPFEDVGFVQDMQVKTYPISRPALKLHFH